MIELTSDDQLVLTYKKGKNNKMGISYPEKEAKIGEFHLGSFLDEMLEKFKPVAGKKNKKTLFFHTQTFIFRVKVSGTVIRKTNCWMKNSPFEKNCVGEVI